MLGSHGPVSVVFYPQNTREEDPKGPLVPKIPVEGPGIGLNPRIIPTGLEFLRGEEPGLTDTSIGELELVVRGLEHLNPRLSGKTPRE